MNNQTNITSRGLAKYSVYELNIMVMGIPKYIKTCSCDVYDAYILGVYTNEIVSNILIYAERQRGEYYRDVEAKSNDRFLDKLDKYEDLLPFLVSYLYDSFKNLPVDEKYSILQREYVPNLQLNTQ